MLVGHWRKEEERQSGRSKTKEKEGRNKEIMNKSTYKEMQITWARSWSQSYSFCHAGRASRKEQCTWFRVNPVLGCPGWEAPCAVTNVLICKWRNLEPQEKWCPTPPSPANHMRGTQIWTPLGAPLCHSDAHKQEIESVRFPPSTSFILSFSPLYHVHAFCSLDQCSGSHVPDSSPRSILISKRLNI